MANQQFLKKRHIGPGSDCENMVRPDIGLMGRKNKMTGVISIMEQNGVEAGMEHGREFERHGRKAAWLKDRGWTESKPGWIEPMSD